MVSVVAVILCVNYLQYALPALTTYSTESISVTIDTVVNDVMHLMYRAARAGELV